MCASLPTGVCVWHLQHRRGSALSTRPNAASESSPRCSPRRPRRPRWTNPKAVGGQFRPSWAGAHLTQHHTPRDGAEALRAGFGGRGQSFLPAREADFRTVVPVEGEVTDLRTSDGSLKRRSGPRTDSSARVMCSSWKIPWRGGRVSPATTGDKGQVWGDACRVSSLSQ
jgi:hypothetical protein